MAKPIGIANPLICNVYTKQDLKSGASRDIGVHLVHPISWLGQFRFSTLHISGRLIPPKSVEEIANKRGVSMAQVSVAWTLSKEGQLRFFDVS